MTRNCPHTSVGRWRYALMVLLLLLFPVVSGCTATATPAEPVTIRFAYGMEDTSFYQPLIEEFSAAHPNITIELTEAGDDEGADVTLSRPSSWMI